MDFRQVYDEHVAFVWRSLRRLGVRDAVVKDAVQDVFLVVHRRLPEYSPQAKVTTWLFRICLNTARDQRRRAHVRREVLGDDGLEVATDPREGADRVLERREDLALFEAAVGRIDLDQRAVFILFELEDMTGEQIAESLEIPLGTVYSRLRLAREAFRKAVTLETARERSRRVESAR
jgi:RNA polymerase sigma-70 factor (ECF subfamily)